MQRPGGEKITSRFFRQSSWANYTIATDKLLARVPGGFDLDHARPYGGSIISGAGTVLKELRPHPGSFITIFAAGNVGLSAVTAARPTRATILIAVDRVPERRSLTRELGA
jgi:aryl-alcohol dehydrogenase